MGYLYTDGFIFSQADQINTHQTAKIQFIFNLHTDRASGWADTITKAQTIEYTSN
jgi:hypothetical protein